MKYFITLTIVLFAFLQSFSQSFVLIDSFTNVNVTNTIVTINVAANTKYVRKYKIQNIAGKDINYKVERIYLTAPICQGTDAYFCATGMCYPPDPMIIQSSMSSTILANQTLPSGPGTYGIDTDFEIGATCCSEDITYKVINIDSAADFVTVTLRYQCSIGIDDREGNKATLNIYPNPVHTFVNVKYDYSDYVSQGQIVIYDVLGKKVKDLLLDNKKGIEKMNVSNFNAGEYFCCIVADGKIIATQKFLINPR